MNTVQKTVFLLIVLGLITVSIPYTHSSGAGEPFDAPPAPLRQPAEFEPMHGVLIRYPFGIPYDLIAEMAEDVEVVTIVASQSEQTYVVSQYQSHGVNLSNCDFLIAQSDTYWTRDYGPWFVFTGNGDMAVVDFTYNRPQRPHDNQIPQNFALAYGYDHYLMPLIHTGGNYMTDGHGISVSTDLVWDENALSHEEINDTVFNYLGVHTYHVVPDPLDSYIDHIDCWAKFLAPDKIMIIEVPPGDPQYDDVENAVAYFENQTSCYGTPYQIYRVPSGYTTSPGEPYINSLILNNKILVPLSGSPMDAAALQAYQNAMPGYDVIGFLSGSWIPTDALHCRAKGIPDREMLYIDHTPLTGEMDAGTDGFLVEANITPYSGENITNASVCWKVEGGSWTYLHMNHTVNFTYCAHIPPQPGGTKIYYYLHAEDASGRKENHPYIGAPQAHFFTSAMDTLSINISLAAGWNLITVPVENNYTASGIAAAVPECTMLASWDAGTGTYTTFIVGITPPGSPWDFAIDDGIGYYVKVSNDTVLSLNGTSLGNVSVSLYPGWNTIGWWKDVPTTASSLAGNITACTMLAMWDAETGTYTTFIVGITPPGSPWDFAITCSMGILAKVSSGSEWHGEG